MDSISVHIAVLTIADDPATADRATARAIGERATSAGHQVVDEETVKDNESAIRDQLVRWIAEPNIDVVIVAATAESESASAALAPLIMQTLPGFTDLFRWLTFQEIGASAMQSTAEAAQCESTFVFVLPAHEGAVAAAMTKLILPQLDVRTQPKNLVTQMPRLKDAAKRVQAEIKSQPVAAPVKPAAVVPPTQADITTAPYATLPPADPVVAPVEAVPQVISSEKTVGGSGLTPKQPARANVNTIARKQDDPPTKQIDLANLEKQIAMSNASEQTKEVVALTANDAKTKVVDMSAHQAKTRVVDTSRLPRLPPGADEMSLDDDTESLTFLTPPSGGVPAQHSVRTSAPIGVVKSSPSASTPPSIHQAATPPFATPIARSTPPTGRQAVSTPPIPTRTPPAGTQSPVKPPAAVPSIARQGVTTPPVSTPVVPSSARQGVTTPSVSTPVVPSSARQGVTTPPVSTPVVPSSARQGVTTPVSTPVVPSSARQGVTTPVSTPVVTPSGTRETTPPISTGVAPSSTGETTPPISTGVAPSSTGEASPSVSPPIVAPETVSPPIVAPRPPTEPPPMPKRSATEPPPVPLGRPPTGPAPVAVAKLDEPAPASTPDALAVEPPGRPTPQPNAAELWARATGATIADAKASETTTTTTASSAVESQASDDAESTISNLFANQPVRKRPPTPPPAHLDSLAKQITGGELPQGEFAYPIKRGGMPLLLKLVLALAVLGAGFFAFVKFYPLTEQSQQAAAVAPSEPAPSEPAAPPPSEPAATAEAADPEIEIEMPSEVAKPTTKPVKPRGEEKPANAAVTKPTMDPVTKPETSTDSKPAAAPEPVDDGCDEVSCVLAKYDRPCCERYRPTEGFTPKNAVPEELDKPMVKAGMEKVKPRIVACGEKGGIKGTVKIAVTVDSEGTVKNATVVESPDQALGVCVAAAMRNAKFAKTVKGGEFTYPYVF